MSLALTSCDQDNEGAIYNSANNNVTWELNEMETTTAENDIVVPVMVTRNHKNGAQTVHYTVEASDADVLSDDCNGQVTFADGETTAFVNVKASNMEKGSTYTYTMTLADADVADADENVNNVNKEITVTIISDYTWVDAGTAIFIDGIETDGGECEVQVLQAKESTNPLIFRLHEPYQTLFDGSDDAAYFTEDGDFEFSLTPNGDPISLKSGNIIESKGGAYGFYYDPVNWGNYCYFEREGNHYYVGGLLTVGGAVKYIASFEFIYDLP